MTALAEADGALAGSLAWYSVIHVPAGAAPGGLRGVPPGAGRGRVAAAGLPVAVGGGRSPALATRRSGMRCGWTSTGCPWTGCAGSWPSRLHGPGADGAGTGGGREPGPTGDGHGAQNGRGQRSGGRARAGARYAHADAARTPLTCSTRGTAGHCGYGGAKSSRSPSAARGCPAALDRGCGTGTVHAPHPGARVGARPGGPSLGGDPPRSPWSSPRLWARPAAPPAGRWRGRDGSGAAHPWTPPVTRRSAAQWRVSSRAP